MAAWSCEEEHLRAELAAQAALLSSVQDAAALANAQAAEAAAHAEALEQDALDARNALAAQRAQHNAAARDAATKFAATEEVWALTHVLCRRI